MSKFTFIISLIFLCLGAIFIVVLEKQSQKDLDADKLRSIGATKENQDPGEIELSNLARIETPEPEVIQLANDPVFLEGDVYATYFESASEYEQSDLIKESYHYADFQSMRSSEVADPQSENNQRIVQSMISKRRERLIEESSNQ
jgi:hypothetical protein